MFVSFEISVFFKKNKIGILSMKKFILLFTLFYSSIVFATEKKGDQKKPQNNEEAYDLLKKELEFCEKKLNNEIGNEKNERFQKTVDDQPGSN